MINDEFWIFLYFPLTRFSTPSHSRLFYSYRYIILPNPVGYLKWIPRRCLYEFRYLFKLSWKMYNFVFFLSWEHASLSSSTDSCDFRIFRCCVVCGFRIYLSRNVRQNNANRPIIQQRMCVSEKGLNRKIGKFYGESFVIPHGLPNNLCALIVSLITFSSLCRLKFWVNKKYNELHQCNNSQQKHFRFSSAHSGYSYCVMLTFSFNVVFSGRVFCWSTVHLLSL